MASSTEEAANTSPWADANGRLFIGMAQPYADPLCLYTSVPTDVLHLLDTTGIPVEALHAPTKRSLLHLASMLAWTAEPFPMYHLARHRIVTLNQGTCLLTGPSRWFCPRTFHTALSRQHVLHSPTLHATKTIQECVERTNFFDKEANVYGSSDSSSPYTTDPIHHSWRHTGLLSLEHPVTQQPIYAV
jgi:hypothetical protein